MPTVLRIDGHRFFFYSNEGSEPSHIHVETAEKSAKFWLEPVALAFSHGYNSGELRKIRQIVVEHSETFNEAWHDYFDSE